MRGRMKTLRSAVAIASLTLVSAAALASPIEATIPFEFRIGDQVFPPAAYIFETSSGSEPHVLGIRAKTSGEKRLFDTLQIPIKDDPKTIGLVFDKIGDTTYLMEVWGVTDSGRGVKHTVDGKPLAAVKNASRQKITATRIVDEREK